MARRTAIQILEERLEELQNELEEYKAKEDEDSYTDEWKWRHIRKLSKKENLNLPLPRLEIRYSHLDDYHVSVDYGIVYEHFLKEINFVPFSSTKIGGRVDKNKIPPKDRAISYYLPHRDGAHVYHDKKHMSLPAYLVVNEEQVYELKDESER